MGTGVGEAALAAEAIGAAEAAGAVAGGAGFLEGMAGVSALEGAGVAGLGLGTGAGLTSGLATAGGLGSLAPAFQTALGETAIFNPEIAAQTAQFANIGAVPNASAALGAGQIGDPALAQLVNTFQNAPTSAQLAAQYGPGTDLARVSLGTVTDAGGSVVGDALARNAPYFADVGGTGVSSGLPFPTGGATVTPPLPPLSPATAADVAQAMDVGFNPATATTEMGGNLARQTMNYVNPVDMMQAPTAEVAKTGLGSLNPFTAAYDAFKSLDKPTQYGLGGIGALQAAKYLNRQPGVAPIPGYSGPLSKFTYSPDTYRPYTYKPYAAGGPVEEMSRENAMGANTGYPQADIRQGAYATPWQTPVSRNVVAGADDANVDMMTGAERMAEGGEASSGAASSDAAAGDSGIAALGPMMYSPSMMSSSLVDPAEAYAAAQPTMNMSQQNFQDFLARYQNMPGVAPATPSATVPLGADAVVSRVSPNAAYYPAGSRYANMTNDQLVEAARKVSFEQKPGYQRELELIQGNNVAPVSDPYGYANWQRGYDIGMAGGGIANLGGYSDGGRLLKGPGDGMSDNIPASISGKQPARLADGEFVVPADVVSGLGNGSTDAGAKQLYKMLDKVRAARTGTKKQGKQIKPEKYTPA